MMSWLFGATPHECKLILQPDNSAKILPGFKSGDSLNVSGTAGESVGALLARFNMYRGPDSQITKLWNVDGTPLPFSTPVSGTLVAIVKAQ
jgi:hypothetical protein